MMNYPTLSAFRWVPKVYQERCKARPAFRKALAETSNRSKQMRLDLGVTKHGRKLRRLEIDHDPAHRTRLASENIAVLDVVGDKAIGAIVLDRAFEKGDLASTALTGTA